jgi:hypothetical protein
MTRALSGSSWLFSKLFFSMFLHLFTKRVRTTTTIPKKNTYEAVSGEVEEANHRSLATSFEWQSRCSFLQPPANKEEQYKECSEESDEREITHL